MTDGRARILFVGALPPLTIGASIVNTQLLSGLHRLGYRVHALAPITKATQSQADEIAGSAGFPVTWFNVRNFGSDPHNKSHARNPDRLASPVRKALNNALAEEPPDVILVGDENSIAGVAPTARQHDVPFIAIAHGVINGILADRYNANLSEIVMSGMRQADMIVTVAHHMAEGLKGLGIQNAVTIANRVDTNRFRSGSPSRLLQQQFDSDEDNIVVISVGSLRMLKRPMDLITSAEQVLRQNQRIRYVSIGDGPCRKEVEAAISNGGIADRFQILGKVPHAEVPDYYRLADILITTSEREGLPLACLEAMASGCVVLASNIPATRELVQDGVTGAVFPLGDVEALARATLGLAGDPALRARIACRARVQIEKKYDAKGWALAYGDAIETVLARGR